MAKSTLAVGLLVLLAVACEATPRAYRDRQDVKESVEVERADAHKAAAQFEKETDALNSKIFPTEKKQASTWHHQTAGQMQASYLHSGAMSFAAENVAHVYHETPSKAAQKQAALLAAQHPILAKNHILSVPKHKLNKSHLKHKAHKATVAELAAAELKNLAAISDAAFPTEAPKHAFRHESAAQMGARRHAEVAAAFPKRFSVEEKKAGVKVVDPENQADRWARKEHIKIKHNTMMDHVWGHNLRRVEHLDAMQATVAQQTASERASASSAGSAELNQLKKVSAETFNDQVDLPHAAHVVTHSFPTKPFPPHVAKSLKAPKHSFKQKALAHKEYEHLVGEMKARKAHAKEVHAHILEQRKARKTHPVKA